MTTRRPDFCVTVPVTTASAASWRPASRGSTLLPLKLETALNGFTVSDDRREIPRMMLFAMPSQR